MPKKLVKALVVLPTEPKTERQKFEAWVATWFPGFKTRFITAIGAIGSLAASLQEYLGGVHLDQFISGKNLAITMGVLFTLAYWFTSISNRYKPQVKEDI